MAAKKIRIGDSAGKWGSALAVIGLVGAAAHFGFGGDESSHEPVADYDVQDVYAMLTTLDKGNETSLSGAGQVTRQQGPLIYVFNYESGHVHVSSHNSPATFETFAEFENDTMIETTRDTACDIASNINQIGAAGKNIDAMGQSSLLQTYLTYAQNFEQSYCPSAPPAPTKAPGARPQ